jgi:hypothetical protein
MKVYGVLTFEVKQEVEYWAHQGIQQAGGYPAKGGPWVSFMDKGMASRGHCYKDGKGWPVSNKVRALSVCYLNKKGQTLT